MVSSNDIRPRGCAHSRYVSEIGGVYAVSIIMGATRIAGIVARRLHRGVKERLAHELFLEGDRRRGHDIPARFQRDFLVCDWANAGHGP